MGNRKKTTGFQTKNKQYKKRKAVRRTSERLSADGADSSSDVSAGGAHQPHDSQPSAVPVHAPSVALESPKGDGPRRSKRQRIAENAPEPAVPDAVVLHSPTRISERDPKLARKSGQLQPFVAVFPQKCIGQLASFGPT